MINDTANDIPFSSHRVAWLDVLKGVGIVSVVWGHAAYPYSYLMFFFHMPLFFFISGYLYKPNTAAAHDAIIKRAKHLLLPYVFYLAAITAALAMIAVIGNNPVEINWKALVLGGSKLEGPYGTFWFVTCLFCVQTVYDLIYRRLPDKRYVVLIVMLCYLLAFWESRYHQDIFIAWNSDVALFGIVFYALGHLCKMKKWLENPRVYRVIALISAIFLILFFYAYFQEHIRFGMDLKHRQYYFFGTNILVPAAAIALLAFACLKSAKWKWFRRIASSLGESSMAIMYLHLFVNGVISRYYHLTPLYFLAIGIFLPWVWHQIASRIHILRFMALGVSKRPSK